MLTGSYNFTVSAGGRKQKMRTDIQHTFNSFMDGIDRNDHKQSSYCTYIRSWKWWKRLYFLFQDLAIINAHVLKDTVLPLSHLDYRLELCDAMSAAFPVPTHTSQAQEKKQMLGCRLPAASCTEKASCGATPLCPMSKRGNFLLQDWRL